MGASWAPPLMNEWGKYDYRPDLHEVSMSDHEEVFGSLLYTVVVVPLQVLIVLHRETEQSKVGSLQCSTIMICLP